MSPGCFQIRNFILRHLQESTSQQHMGTVVLWPNLDWIGFKYIVNFIFQNCFYWSTWGLYKWINCFRCLLHTFIKGYASILIPYFARPMWNHSNQKWSKLLTEFIAFLKEIHKSENIIKIKAIYVKKKMILFGLF